MNREVKWSEFSGGGQDVPNPQPSANGYSDLLCVSEFEVNHEQVRWK